MRNLQLFQFTLFLTVLLLSYATRAQVSGGNPPSVRWKQISTPEAKIIFPAKTVRAAERAANVISLVQKDTFLTSRPRKLSIVLQNKTLQSNGYVGLAPFRSEFFTAPPQNVFTLGSVPWIDLLSIHEYRHAMQYNHLNTGLTHVANVLFGQGGEALAHSAAVPNWFFEGGAVFSETKWTRQGRGRLPAFFNGYKSLWQQNRRFSYMKLRNGSLKDYVPNHYPLGYMLTVYGNEQYGPRFWDMVSYDAASFKHLLYPFQNAFKSYAQTTFEAFREETFEHFRAALEVDTAAAMPQRQEFIDEQFPVLLENNDLLLVKSSYSNLPAFVLRTRKGDKKLRDLDYSLDNYFTYSNGKIIYTTSTPDSRWGNRTYNEIVLLDIETGNQKRITKNTRYYSPAINAAGDQIIAVHYDEQNETFLHLLNVKKGNLEKEFDNSARMVYSHPKYSNDSVIISEVRDTLGRMSIMRMNLKDDKTDFLLPFTYRTIGFPVFKSDTLFFTASFEKEDVLMGLSLQSGNLFTLAPRVPVGSHAGNYAITYNDSTLGWFGFTAFGNKVFTTPSKNIVYTNVDPGVFSGRLSAIGAPALNRKEPAFPRNSYTVTKYSQTRGLLNFHTLLPEIDDPDYSLSLLSENILNTFHSTIYGSYNRAEKFKRLGMSATFSGLFPLITAGAQYTIDRRTIYKSTPVYFNQFEPFGGISIPLNLSRGRFFTFARTSSNFTYNSTAYTGNFKDSFPSFSYSYLNNLLTFSNQVQKALQNVYPRYAQTMSINYKTALSRYEGNQLTLNTTLYFPGLFTNHSFAINAAYLKKDSLNQIHFSSAFPFSRGYNGINRYKMYKLGANYYFPIAYPDVGFGNILYLLRLRSNLFYDFTQTQDFRKEQEKLNRNYASAGVELTFDTKWWNQVPVSFGVRYSHRFNRDILEKGNGKWEIIVPVNIFQR